MLRGHGPSLLLMRQFKPFQSFRNEDDKNLWLKRRDVFSRALPYFSLKHRAIAVLGFDADLTGVAVKPHALSRLLGLARTHIDNAIRDMESRCVKLMADEKI
jgi:hypothetical protein